MFVQYWMAKSLIVATEEMNLEEALYLMQRRKIRRLPVVRGDNELRGIIALSDIYPYVGPHAMTKALLSKEVTQELQKVRVGAVMTASPITCPPRATIDEVGVVMRRRKIGAIPVVEGLTVVGIVTESDILSALATIAQVGSDSRRILFRIPLTNRMDIFYKTISLCEKNGIEILTILIQAVPEERGHLVMLRVRGKNVQEFIDLLRSLRYDVLAAQSMPLP
ncbi:MAG: CBS domain-containing protein [Deltaproteobacteria bacterium]|nr:CBS domain-containing protein [Deltaproteobacteria bacterium]